MNHLFERLTKALEGVSPEALDAAEMIEGKSIKEICCLLTAWDGERMRRVRVVTGESFQFPHDPYDQDYWSQWEQQQVEVKKVMSPQGVMVDLVGTHQRLVSQITELNDFYFTQWIESDPQAVNTLYAHYIPKIEAWRQIWTVSLQEGPLPQKTIPRWLAWLRRKTTK